jgi:hypothetical protein
MQTSVPTKHVDKREKPRTKGKSRMRKKEKEKQKKMTALVV